MSTKKGKGLNIQGVKSTTKDTDISASLIDSISYSSSNQEDTLILRGIEAGPGISIKVVDCDNDVFNTKEKKIVISYDGHGPTPPPGPTPTPCPENLPEGVYLNPTITVDKKGCISDIKNGIPVDILGEVNTGGNLGYGFPIFARKTGKQLEFKTLIPGEGIDIQEFEDQLIISAPASCQDNRSFFMNTFSQEIDDNCCSCTSNTGLTKEFIKEECNVIIPENHQIMVYGTYRIEGKLINHGRLVVL